MNNGKAHALALVIAVVSAFTAPLLLLLIRKLLSRNLSPAIHFVILALSLLCLIIALPISVALYRTVRRYLDRE